MRWKNTSRMQRIWYITTVPFFFNLIANQWDSKAAASFHAPSSSTCHSHRLHMTESGPPAMHSILVGWNRNGCCIVVTKIQEERASEITGRVNGLFSRATSWLTRIAPSISSNEMSPFSYSNLVFCMISNKWLLFSTLRRTWEKNS